MSVVIGIDPGRKGAVAHLRPDGSVVFEDMPYLALGGFDPATFTKRVCGWQRPANVAVENVGGALRDGAKNAFAFGHAVGAMETCLILQGLSFHRVNPALWKLRMGLRNRTKRESLMLARKLYPAAEGLDLMKHEGRAEALLIAHYHLYGGLGRV